MKTFQRQLVRITLCTLLATVLSCHDIKPDTLLLYSPTRGYWEWVSTTTRAGKITPKTVGYTKQLVNDIDPNEGSSTNYLAFYKNSTFQHRYNETRIQQLMPDFTDNTIIVQYDTVGSLKWYVNVDSDTVQISEFLNPYSSTADTIRSTYKKNSALRGVLKLPVK